MKRFFPLFLLLILPAAAAQSADGACTQSEPCPWIFDVDSTGIDDGTAAPAWNFTAGDWVQLEVFNFDDVQHTLSIADQVWVVASFDTLQSAPFQLAAGEYTLTDEPTGDAAPVSVLAGEDASPKGIPPAGMPLLLAGLMVSVGAARRFHRLQ